MAIPSPDCTQRSSKDLKSLEAVKIIGADHVFEVIRRREGRAPVAQQGCSTLPSTLLKHADYDDEMLNIRLFIGSVGGLNGANFHH